jgi:hypothetical protein
MIARQRGDSFGADLAGGDAPTVYDSPQLYVAFAGGGNRAMLGTASALAVLKELVRPAHARTPRALCACEPRLAGGRGRPGRFSGAAHAVTRVGVRRGF